MVSKDADKQRKRLYNLPKHRMQKNLVSRLSEELMVKYNYAIRRFPVRTGDSVKIVRGDFKGKSGKIREVNTKSRTAAVENITRSKVDGKQATAWVDTSNIIITKLDLTDNYRKNKIKAIFEEKGVDENLEEE